MIRRTVGRDRGQPQSGVVRTHPVQVTLHTTSLGFLFEPFEILEVLGIGGPAHMLRRKSQNPLSFTSTLTASTSTSTSLTGRDTIDREKLEALRCGLLVRWPESPCVDAVPCGDEIVGLMIEAIAGRTEDPVRTLGRTQMAEDAIHTWQPPQELPVETEPQIHCGSSLSLPRK